MFSCSSSQSYSLVHCSVLCQCHCLSTVSHSLFILLPLFIHLFPPHTPHPSLALFHNPDEKTGECALKIFRRGRRVFGREARRGDEEGRRAKGEAQKKKKQRENTTRRSPPPQSRRRETRSSVSCKTRLESHSKQRGHGGGCGLEACRTLQPVRARTLCTYAYTCAPYGFSREVRCFLQWLTL